MSGEMNYKEMSEVVSLCKYCERTYYRFHNCPASSMGNVGAKGDAMPRTIEHYQANAMRDQELILEQKEEISKLKAKINKLEQRHATT